MNKSDSIKELAGALAAAQGEMPAAELNAVNPFLKNKFADLGSIVSAAKPVLAKHGLSVSQLPTATEDGRIGVTTILMHSSGEWLESSISLPLGDEKGKSLAQVAGSIITYLRRYSLASVLGMYAEEDGDGGETPSARRPAQKKPAEESKIKSQPPIYTAKAREQWEAFLTEANITEEKAVAALGTESVAAWIKLGKGRTLETAMHEIKTLMGL